MFNKYAQIYDLLNKDKDYRGEAVHISEVLKKYNVETGSSVLNFGCGTGRHDYILSDFGYKMTGVDVSGEMVKIANHNSPDSSMFSEPPSLSEREGLGESCFLQGDIRSVDLNKKFDAVISMFHVMSYQNKNSDVVSVINNAKKHLGKEGIFLFDCWYGPAVLKDRPEKRKRIAENDELKVIRSATPELKEEENVVVVNYDFYIKGKDSGEINTYSEQHSMRYFFLPEIRYFLETCGFEMLFYEVNGWNIEVGGRVV